MKKLMVLFMTLLMIFTLAGCGEKNGGEPTQGSAPTEAKSEKQEVKVYGIGEAAEADGLAITIDKVVSPDPDIFLNGPQEGFAYIQVYYTFKNVSNETIETPKRQAIYIVYKEGPTGDDCDMTSDESSVDVLPGKKDGLYEAFTELAPGESTSGWMVYPRSLAKSEVTMHYYSKFVNVPPTLVFGFTAP
ncbi:MAG: lipoprotein [Syntrophomonadaceae bacterium]|nr:hypothetical protein [Bacillota bacterium]NLP24287.1 hypothetical protein [Syntrophomonadaceae bacterium]